MSGDALKPSVIGKYQLENLLSKRVPFLFFDLSLNSDSSPLLQSSLRLKPDEVEGHLKNVNAAFEAPIVLICEDQLRSNLLGDALTTRGYVNVYVVRGGIAGLG
jgi:rhodanese-related sulfurtransferase